MNYYEELGIPNTASVEKVRKAYRNLARLLHPDHQSDETLRSLADIQMARLHQILETLTDVGLRAGYDRSLRREANKATAAAWMRARRMAPRGMDVEFREGPRWSRVVWPAAGVVGIGLMAALLARDPAVQRLQADGDVIAGVQREQGSGAWPVRTEGLLAVPKRNADNRAGKSFSGYPEPASDDQERQYFNSKSNRATRTDSREVTVVTGIAGMNSELTDRSPGAKFLGEWYYAKPPQLAEPDGMCRPVYIDMEISESRGEVRGKYSARYVVGERPISPFVQFKFTGPGREPAADLGWSAAGGAVGRVRLTLLSERSLRVDWNADQWGDTMGLASGTATLLRRNSP